MYHISVVRNLCSFSTSNALVFAFSQLSLCMHVCLCAVSNSCTHFKHVWIQEPALLVVLLLLAMVLVVVAVVRAGGGGGGAIRVGRTIRDDKEMTYWILRLHWGVWKETGEWWLCRFAVYVWWKKFIEMLMKPRLKMVAVFATSPRHAFSSPSRVST